MAVMLTCCFPKWVVCFLCCLAENWYDQRSSPTASVGGQVARERAHTTNVVFGHNSCHFSLFKLQVGAKESCDCGQHDACSAEVQKIGGAQHQDFERGLPPYYYSGPTQLSFRERTGSGVVCVVWPCPSSTLRCTVICYVKCIYVFVWLS